MIDDTDYAILKAVQELGGAVWKSKIHDYVQEHREELPLSDGASIQTIGRRVDSLNNDGFLETAIIQPDELRRKLIIAFKLTEAGADAIADKEEELLRDVVQDAVETGEPQFGAKVIARLIGEELELEEDLVGTLQEDYTKDELVAFLMIYIAEAMADDTFDEDNIWKFHHIDRRKTAFRDLLQAS